MKLKKCDQGEHLWKKKNLKVSTKDITGEKPQSGAT